MEKLAELKKIKEALEVLINESEKPKFEVNKWYVLNCDGCFLVNISKIEDNNIFGYGFNHYGTRNEYIENPENSWVDIKSLYSYHLATQKEVQEALTKEAIKRGVKEGVKCKGIKYTTKQIIHDNINFDYWFNDNILWVDAADETRSIVIFRNGTWATVLPNKKQMTISQIESELGYEIEIINNL